MMIHQPFSGPQSRPLSFIPRDGRGSRPIMITSSLSLCYSSIMQSPLEASKMESILPTVVICSYRSSAWCKLARWIAFNVRGPCVLPSHSNRIASSVLCERGLDETTAMMVLVFLIISSSHFQACFWLHRRLSTLHRLAPRAAAWLARPGVQSRLGSSDFDSVDSCGK